MKIITLDSHRVQPENTATARRARRSPARADAADFSANPSLQNPNHSNAPSASRPAKTPPHSTRWRNRTDAEKITAITSEFFKLDGWAITLNVSPDVENELRTDGLAPIMKRITEGFRKAWGWVPQILLALDIDRKGRLHLHGSLGGITDNQLDAARGILRRAGGRWAAQRGQQFQVKFKRIYERIGWADYITRHHGRLNNRVPGRLWSCTQQIRHTAQQETEKKTSAISVGNVEDTSTNSAGRGARVRLRRYVAHPCPSAAPGAGTGICAEMPVNTGSLWLTGNPKITLPDQSCSDGAGGASVVAAPLSPGTRQNAPSAPRKHSGRCPAPPTSGADARPHQQAVGIELNAQRRPIIILPHEQQHPCFSGDPVQPLGVLNSAGPCVKVQNSNIHHVIRPLPAPPRRSS